MVRLRDGASGHGPAGLRRPNGARSATVVGALLIVLVAPSACGPWRDYRTPETVGVVTAESADRLTVTIEDAAGNVTRIAITDYDGLDGAASPVVGDLLMLGTKPSPWFERAARQVSQGPECYLLDGPLTIRGDAVEFQVGLRLPKAPSFAADARSDSEINAFACLDTRARAVSAFLEGQ
jgi:hypothetical protein